MKFEIRQVSDITALALTLAERRLEDAQAEFERTAGTIARVGAVADGIAFVDGWKLDQVKREWFRPITREAPNDRIEEADSDASGTAGG